MGDIVIIKENDAYIITIDRSKCIYSVILKEDKKYNETEFEEFLEYFKNTWGYIMDNKLKYHQLIKLGVNGNKDNELPLDAYIKLIKTITEINDILNNFCHSICILTNGSTKWKNAYELGTKLWKPVKQRPLLFTEESKDMEAFFLTHKLMPQLDTLSEWVECEDGGFVRK
jgi:hypothetical protein|tara:strand:- start:412 stop:924 length:513 start_codon:yes stop_codon:yes gene_type:complete